MNEYIITVPAQYFAPHSQMCAPGNVVSNAVSTLPPTTLNAQENILDPPAFLTSS